MTTRFSLAELADMLHVDVVTVRRAVDDLASQGLLTAESFVFNERNWRVAPSDVKRVTEWLHQRNVDSEPTHGKTERRIKKKRIREPEE